MKRMLDQKKIDWLNDTDLSEISALLSNLSIDTAETPNVIYFHSLKVDKIELDSDGATGGEIFMENLTHLVDELDNPLFPFENNAGKVLAVNEDEDGLVAVEKGTKLYTHNININNDALGFMITSTRATPFTLLDIIAGFYVGDSGTIVISAEENDSWIFSPYRLTYNSITNKLYAVLGEVGGSNLSQEISITISSFEDIVIGL